MAEQKTYAMMQLLDPFGFWKAARDTSLESWGKLMIDVVNTDAYAQLTGLWLDQYMSVFEPVQDSVQKTMTLTLPFFNLPAREEVISVAKQLVNVETRLDDLDNQTYESGEESRKQIQSVERRIGKLEERIGTSEEAVSKEIRSMDRSLEKVLTTILARLDDLEASIVPVREAPAAKSEPKAEAKAEPKSEPKAEPKK